MLNTTDRPAKLYYGDGHFDILSPGTYVVCAVTGENIPLARLRYWSVDRQEAYIDADASLTAEKRAGKL
jgi:hypothetical protein